MNENSNVGVTETLSVKTKEKPKFYIVETKSVFSNVYVVSGLDVNNTKEAIEYVLSSNNIPDFVQLHKGEEAVGVVKIDNANIKEQLKKLYPNHA